MDFSDVYRSAMERAGAGNFGSYGGGGGYGGGYGGFQGGYSPQQYNINNFNQLYEAVSQMNNEQQPWLRAQQQSQDVYGQQRDAKMRKMTDLERFSKGAADVSQWLGSAFGNAVMGELPEFADPYAYNKENALRMLLNTPGMIVGSIPDMVAYGTEIAANAPVQEADSKTGMIQDRALTDEERWGDIGYLGLGALGMVPGLGAEGKAGGLAMKGLGKAAKAVGAESVGNAMSKAGTMGLRGTTKGGLIETVAETTGKTGKQLNPYRWGDALLETANTALFEGAQEAGQEYFQIMREGELDPDSPFGLNEENVDRLQKAGVWGGFAGGAFGGITNAGSTALVNSRANRGLDRYGNPFQSLTPKSGNEPSNFYKYAADTSNLSDASVLPEVGSWMTDEFGRQDARYRAGMSFKGVPGEVGQKTHTIIYGTRGIRRAYQAANDNEKEVYAKHWGFTKADFDELLKGDDEHVASVLDEVAKERMAPDADVKKRIILTSSKAPNADPNSMMTFFVGGVTAGNTVSFAPGVPGMSNADLDGDMFTLYVDDTMGSWDHLPTRRLMGMREMPAKEGEKKTGKVGLGYGKPTFNFEAAGIIPEAFSDTVVDISKILERYGFANRQMSGYWGRKLSNAFKVSKAEEDSGVTWQHKFTKVLVDMRDYFNEIGRPLLGDDIVSDVLAHYSVEGSSMLVARRAAEAYGVNGAPSVELQSTLEGIPTSPGAVPPGKIAIAQFMEYLGYVTHGISTSGNPMFRFKQMGAWMQKLVKMTRDVANTMGVHDINDIEAVVKWSMQMVNDLHLPVDYAETLFRTTVMARIQEDLGMTGAPDSNRIGSGITYEQFKKSVKDNWNAVAAEYKKASQKFLTTEGLQAIDFSWNKTIVDDDQKNSASRAIMTLFGDWSGDAIASVNDDGLTLSGMVEKVASDPFDYNVTKYDYVGGGFSEMFQDLVDDYNGDKAAQMSSLDQQIDTIVDESTKGAVKFDDDGHASWDSEYDIEVTYRAGWLLNLLGVAKGLYLSVPGVKYLANSGWAKYLLSSDPDKIKRGLVAMGVRYNWREYIAAREAGNINAKAALNAVDFSNPLNRYILRWMLIEGERETGITGELSDKPLEMFTDPSRQSYDELSKMFDENVVQRVRIDSNMLLYHALDDGEMVVTGSAIGTRMNMAKTYVKALQGNTPAKARLMWHEVKHDISKITGQSPEMVVEALKFHATSNPDVIELDSYAATCHDAAFFSAPAAEKAKSPRGASLHAQSVSLYEGGYSAAFLNQLGVSVGTLSEGVQTQIVDAIRRSVFDPTFTVRISLSGGRYATISQAEVFGAVGKVIGDDGPSLGDLDALFEECPQILLDILPHTYQPLSADADTVTPMLMATPNQLIQTYIRQHDDYRYREGIQKNKVRNKMVSDQDNVILTFGYLDVDYDNLLANGDKWKTAVEDSANEWADFIYSVASISSDSMRQNIIDSKFGFVEMSELDDLKDTVENLSYAIMDMRDRVEERDSNRKLADLHMEAYAETEFDKIGLGRVNLSTESLEGVAGTARAQAESQLDDLRAKMDAEIAVIRYGAGEISGINTENIKGQMSQRMIEEKRALFKYKSENDPNFKMTKEEFENHLERIQKGRIEVIADDSFVSRKDIALDADPEVFISKVEAFVKSGNYKRLEEEYWNELGPIDAWKARVRDAFEDGDVEYLESQLRFWDSEIVESKIQDLKDLYGFGTASDFMSRLRDAKDYVEKMVDEVRTDPTIEPRAVVDPEKIMMPRISFKNKATSPSIEFASVELESGMNPISSGQNAGNYQYLAVLDFIGKDFSCPVPPRTGLTREEAIAFANDQMNSLNIINDDGSVMPVTASELENVSKFPDERIKSLKFAPNSDCLIGCCHIHSAPSITKAPGDYLGGRVTLAELAFFLSEKRVFKSKKKRHVFNKITHTVKHAEDLKNFVIKGRTREEILEEVKLYQEKLAEQVRKVFVDEGMEEEFSLDDARVVAQFMTPMIEISYTDSENKLRRATVAKFALADEKKFNEAVDGIDFSTVAEIKPIPMSILDVCKKILEDVRDDLSAKSQARGGKQPTREELNKAFEKSMYSWSGKAVDSDVLLDFMKGSPVIRKRGNPSVLLGSSPNLMQNLMTNLGSLNRGMVTSVSGMIDGTSFSEDDKAAVKNFNEGLDIDASDVDTFGRKIIVVESRYDDMFKPTSTVDRDIKLHLKMPKINKNFFVNHAVNAVLLPKFGNEDESEVVSAYYSAKASGRALLVPESSYGKLVNWIGRDEVGYATQAGTVSINIGGTDMAHMLIDPFVAGDPIDQVALETDVGPYYPEDVAIDFADYGYMGSDDSGYLLNPEYADMKMHFDDESTISKDVVTGKNVSKGMKRALSRSKPFLPTLDDEARKDLKKQLELAKNDDTKGSSRFLLPDWQSTYKLNDDVTISSVEEYLRLDKRQLQPNGFVKGKVTQNQCLGIISFMYAGDVYYAPIILNTGGLPTELQSVHISDSDLSRGEVKVYWSGNITPKEGEGLKNIFEGVPYKAYGTVMSDEVASRMIRPGFDKSIMDPRTGKQVKITTRGMYSASTEDGRFMDRGLATKIQNLFGATLLKGFSLFHVYENGEWKVDYDRFKKFGWSNREIDLLVTPGCNGIWDSFIYGNRKLHEDPIVNSYIKIVAKNARAANMKAIYWAFSNINKSGRQVLRRFNPWLVYDLKDDAADRFFHALDPEFAYDGRGDQPGPDREGVTPMIDHRGWILGDDGKYHRGHIHFVRTTDDSSMIGQPTARVRYGAQQSINIGLLEGFDTGRGDIKTVLDYAMLKAQDPTAFMIGGKYVDKYFDSLSKKDIERETKQLTERVFKNEYRYLVSSGLSTRKAANYRRKLMQEWRASMSRKIRLASSKDRDKEANLETGSDADMYARSISGLRSALDMEIPLTELEIHRLYRETTASTYNNGKGVTTVSVRQFCEWIDDIADNLRRGVFPFETKMTTTGRPILGYVDSDLLDRLLTGKGFSDQNGQAWTRDAFVAAMEDSVNKTLDFISYLNPGQREAVYTMIDMIAGTYGKPWLSRLLGDTGVHLSDVYSEEEKMALMLGKDPMYPGLKEACDKTKSFVTNNIDRTLKEHHNKVPIDAAPSGFIARLKAEPKKSATNTMSAVSRTLATANPILWASSVILRFKSQGLTRGMLMFERVLPDGTIADNPGIEVKNKDAVIAASKDPINQKIWRAFNVMAWSGEDIVRLQNVNSIEEIENLLDEREKRMSWPERAQAWMFNFASGGSLGVSLQIQNFIYRLGAISNNENAPWLTQEVDNNGKTRYEQFIEENPSNFLIDMLTVRDNNPNYFLASQARNFVISGEHASQSMFGLVLSDWFDRHPIGEAIMITGLCRFPHYAYNVGGWFLNHVAPVSSVAYIIRELAIKKAYDPKGGKFSQYLNDLGVERTQIYTSLREAMMVDAMRIGSTMLAALLYAMGCYDPPDDEYYDEYAGNPGEWTVCGFRVSENWWVIDILGPFGAVAATWASIEHGKPRFDLMQNWMSKALWSNPIMKAADVARSMLDPTEQYLEEYDNISKQYANVEGGAPDMLDAWLDGQITFGLNWFGQFVTPSFMKEISTSREFLKYERSYKKVKDEEGNLKDAEYLDAKIRKVTRNNIVLGFIANALNGFQNETGYVATQMPKVQVPDQNQVDSMEYFSLHWPDGSEKDENYKMVTAFEVIGQLMSTDDMDALYHSGFVIPQETRIYVSQMLNDIKRCESDAYNAWVQETGKDAYILGNGDFTEGLKIRNATDSAFYDDLRNIDNLFDKLWSDELTKGIQYYYREATSYDRTRSGQYYATGFRDSIIPWPVNLAPGTYNAPVLGTRDDGTMGRSGNWETPSEVVEGASAGGRALVPVPSERIVKPKLSDFGDDENGGYSDTEAGKSYADSVKGKAADGTTTDTTSSKKTTPGSGGGSRGGSGGGGGGGGGGGRGYTPSTYAPSVSLSKGNASRIMTRDRTQSPNLDYLRPDFETKGSREAYKRSDI